MQTTRSKAPTDPLVLAVAVAIATVGLSLPADAVVLWEGHFEGGDRGEFERYHAVPSNPPRISIVPTPVADGLNHGGTKAARVEVRRGDDARKLDPVTGEQIGSNDYNERAELLAPYDMTGRTFFREGDDIWFSWQTLFPSAEWWGLDPKGSGTIFFQIHHVKLSTDSYEGSPPLMFIADNEQLAVEQCERFPCASAAVRHVAPLQLDHWYTFVVRMKHSADPAKGRLEVWIDGEKVVDRAAALLFGSDFANYMATGQYRRPGTERTSVLYMDNFVAGTTYEDVRPPEPVEPVPVEPDPLDPSDAPDAPSPIVTPDPDGAGGDLQLVARPSCTQAGAPALGLLLGLATMIRRRRS